MDDPVSIQQTSVRVLSGAGREARALRGDISEKDTRRVVDVILPWGMPMSIRPGEAIGHSIATTGIFDHCVSEVLMRRLELQAGAPPRQGGRGIWTTDDAMRHAEREFALQAQRAYEHTINDRQASKVGAGATPGRASHGSSSEQVARQTTGPKSAL